MTGPNVAPKPVVAVFGPFEADFGRRILSNGANMVHLAPLSWRLLELIVQRAGDTVTKDEVKRHLWPEQHATDYTLSRAVRRVREALDDDARSPRYLRTVHGTGFQWIAGGMVRGTAIVAPPAELPSTFVGRHAHIEQLVGAAATAARGRRQYVAVEGPLGSGKSTLVEEFVVSHLDGWWIAPGRCREPLGDHEPFAPIMEALDRLASSAPTTVVPTIRRFAPTWLAQMPWFIDPRDIDELARAIALSSPARMMRELARCFEELSVTRPVALWLDDAHWADPETIGALDALTARTDRARLLIVTGHRPDDARAAGHPITTLLAERSVRADVRRVALEPFDRSEVRELVDARFASLSSTVRADLTTGLLHWSGGNPLFASVILERLRSVDDDGSALDPVVDVDSFPTSLTVLLDETIDRIDDDVRSLLEIASLVNDEISAELLGDVTGTDPVEIETALVETTATSPVLLPVEPLRQGATSRFAHAAFRERVRARVGRLRAERLHGRIGHALEERHDTSDPRQVAHHLDLGGEPDRAVPYWLAAGGQSQRRFAHHDAAELYERAVSTLAAHDDPADRDHEIAARLGLAMSHLATRTSRDDETRDNIDQLWDLVAPLHGVPDALPVWRATLLVNNLAGRTDRVREMAPALLAMAESRNQPAELVDAHHSMGEASLHAGRLDDARRHFEEARQRLGALWNARTEPTDAQLLRMRDVGARIESARAGVATLQGRHDDARRHVDESLVLTLDGLNTPLVRIGNLTICASIRFLVDDHDGATALADLTIAEAGHENSDFMAIARLVGWAARGVPPADEARAAVRTMLERPTVPFPLGLIVFFRADLLAPAEMLEWLDAAEAQCERVDTHWADAEFLRHRARLLSAEGLDHTEVERHLRRAHEIASAQSSTFFLADIERDLSALQPG